MPNLSDIMEIAVKCNDPEYILDQDDEMLYFFIKHVSEVCVLTSREVLGVFNRIAKDHPSIMEDTLEDILCDRLITSSQKEEIIQMTIKYNPNILKLEVEDEYDIKACEYTYRPMLDVISEFLYKGRRRALSDFYEFLDDNDMLSILNTEEGKKTAAKYTSQKTLLKLYELTSAKENKEEYKDLIIRTINETFPESLYEICHDTKVLNYGVKYKDDNDFDDCYDDYGNLPNRNVTILNDYYLDIIKRVNPFLRKDLVMLALCNDNIKNEDIAKSLSYLRREDIYSMISNMINNDPRFILNRNEDLLRLEDSIIDFKSIDFTELKRRLIDVFAINEDHSLDQASGVNYSIFKFQNIKKSLINEDLLFYLDNFKGAQIEDEKEAEKLIAGMSDDEKIYNYMLLGYEYKNLLMLLSDPNESRKLKSLSNILRDVTQYKALNEHAKKASLILDFPYSANYVERDKTNSFYYSMKEELIRKYYEGLGVNLDEIEVNSNMQNLNYTINYGLEIEELNISSEDQFMKGKNNFETRTEGSIHFINYDTGNENEGDFNLEREKGEYVSKIFDAKSLSNLRDVYSEIELIKILGGEVNSTCGMHIHVSSSDLKDNKEEMTKRMADFFYKNQDMMQDKFMIFNSRIADTCQMLRGNKPMYNDRYRIMNLDSIEKHGSIELRLFNMPNELDPYIVDSYIDFATCMYSYIHDGNNFDERYTEFLKENNIEFTDDLYEIGSKEREEEETLRLNFMLDEFGVKDNTKIILSNLEDIYKFYAVREGNDILVDREDAMNYYDDVNTPIVCEDVISISELVDLYNSKASQKDNDVQQGNDDDELGY